MVVMSPVSGDALGVVMKVVDDGLRSEPGPAMPWPVLIGLLDLIGADSIVFNETDLRSRQLPVQQKVLAGGRCLLDVDNKHSMVGQFWAHRKGFRLNTYQEQTGDLARVLLLSDFYTAGELRNAPYYMEYLRVYDVRHSLMVSLPAAPGYCRRLVLWRMSGLDFSERDRLLLRLLRPHLFDIYLDAERRRRQIPCLTNRQREVLHLAALGHSNADIARELFVSVATVRKHLENIFDRTGVRSRSAAAALILPQFGPAIRPQHANT